MHKKYSDTNSKQASPEDLKIYLDKAKKLEKDGKTLTIVGGLALAAALIWGITDPLGHELGTLLEAGIVGFAGLGSMAVGITIRIIGRIRVKRINTI
jgi:hypothetical protein